MKIKNPAHFRNFQDVLEWAQSVYKAMQHGIGFATPAGGGKYAQDNTDGVMVVIGSGGILGWSGSTAVPHGLQRLPIGFIVCGKNKTCDVYQSGTATTQVIPLTCTDPTAVVTLYIF